MNSLSQETQNILTMFLVHVQSTPDFTREKLIVDLRKIIMGVPIESILDYPEVQLTITSAQQECVSGIMTTESNVGGTK
jgi:hypothetical protein